MDTAANHDLRRLSGAQRRRALRGPDSGTDAANRRARWVAEAEAAFVAAGSVPRPDRWSNDLDEVFTSAS